jgi:hypothetical protein
MPRPSGSTFTWISPKAAASPAQCAAPPGARLTTARKDLAATSIFFQHEAYLHARLPRVTYEKCGIKQVAVPWARPDSGFTLLFEALIMAMVQAMLVAVVASKVKRSGILGAQLLAQSLTGLVLVRGPFLLYRHQGTLPNPPRQLSLLEQF